MSLTANQAEALRATAFEEPTLWTVGDPDSTFQEWVAQELAFNALTPTPALLSNVNPTITADALLSVQSPGFRAGSGGYYAFAGPYGVNAEIYNHGGSEGSGAPYPAGSGTHVIVQTHASLNGGDGVLTDQMQLTDLSGNILAGGANEDLLRVEQLATNLWGSSFGVVTVEELVFEFFLPDFTGDFIVDSTSNSSSSFQHMRVDTFIVAGSGPDPDLDADLDVDVSDLIAWQNSASPDAAGLSAWQNAFGVGAATTAAISAVPEPATAGLICTALGLALLRRPSNRGRGC
ncbi:MAG: PEP-CTERM sorting domain-containing protein [Planctomycetota bacterium]